MLVSNGCHCKVRQTGWLKITDIYSLAVLETRIPDQGVMFPPKSQENPVTLNLRLTLIQYDLMELDYLCKDVIS